MTLLALVAIVGAAHAQPTDSHYVYFSGPTISMATRTMRMATSCSRGHHHGKHPSVRQLLVSGSGLDGQPRRLPQRGFRAAGNCL